MIIEFILENKLLCLLFVIVLAFLLILFIYNVVSNHLNKEVFIDKEDSLRKKKTILKVDFVTNQIFIYENNARELDAIYTFQEFASLINYKYLASWEAYLEKIRSGCRDFNKFSVGLGIINHKTSTRQTVKLVLLNFSNREYGVDQVEEASKIATDKHYKYNNEMKKYIRYVHEAYLSMEVVLSDLNIKNNRVLGNVEFMNEIKSLGGESKASSIGGLYLISLPTINFIRKHYGNDQANRVLDEVFNLVHKLNIKDNISVTYLQNNIFCIFNNAIETKKQCKGFAKTLLNVIDDIDINIFKKRVDLKAEIKFTLFGNGNYDIEETVDHMQKMFSFTNNGIKRRQYIDNVAAQENSQIVLERNELNRLIVENDFKLSYEPIVSIDKFKTFGYYLYTKYNYAVEGFDNGVDNFITIYNLAERYKIRNQFLEKYFTHVYELLLQNDLKNHYYLSIDLYSLDILKKVLINNPAFQKVVLYVIINYDDVIHQKNNIDYINVFKEFEKLNVRVGFFADENMLTVFSNIVNYVDRIIIDKFMINGIEPYNSIYLTIENIVRNMSPARVKYIALGVDKASTFTTLADLNISNIAGKLISEPLKDVSNEDYLTNRKLAALSRSYYDD